MYTEILQKCSLVARLVENSAQWVRKYEFWDAPNKMIVQVQRPEILIRQGLKGNSAGRIFEKISALRPFPPHLLLKIIPQLVGTFTQQCLLWHYKCSFTASIGGISLWHGF